MSRLSQPGAREAAGIPGTRTPWWTWAAIAGTGLPVVTAVGRALRQGWLPMGDDAYFTVRSRDVLGPHHPLVGAWSAGSQGRGGSVNNLGPLQLDLLAPATKVGWAAGTAVGAGALALASVVGVGLVARRLVPPAGVVVVLLAPALVAWTMGSQLLLETRQHHALILPFLLYLVLVWGLAAGDRWLLPWAIGVGTLLVQTHLSYLVLATLLGGFGLVALVVAVHRDGTVPRTAGRAARVGGGVRALAGPGATAVGVGAVLWSQPLVDQVGGRGNLADLLGSGSGEGDGDGAPGATGAVRIVGRLVGWPPSWGRGGFAAFDPAPAAGTGRAAVGLVAVVVLLALAGARARTRGDRAAGAAVVTAGVGLASGLVGVAVTPAGSLGPVVGNYRWLWPLAVFVALAAVLGLGAGARPAPATAGGPHLGRWGGAALVVLVAVTAASVPAHHGLEVTRVDRRLRPVAADLVRQLEAADLRGPLLFERSRAAFTDPYAYVVLAVLQDEGIAFTFDEDGPLGERDVLRFGDGRADEGRASQRLVLVTGPTAHATPPGTERIALASLLDEEDLRRRAAEVDVVIAAVADGSLAVGGRTDDHPLLDRAVAGRAVDPVALARELVRLDGEARIRGRGPGRRSLDALVEVPGAEAIGTVGLFLEPVG